MEQQQKSIHSQSLKAKSKTYFFDVKEAKNGNKYLSITETWIKDGQRHRGNITVFGNDIKEFAEMVTGMADKVQ